MEPIIVKSVEAILHPHKTEKNTMNWIKYIYQTGGGIVWIISYATLYLMPFNFLASKYTAQSMIAWGAIGLLLSIATLWSRFKLVPEQEKELTRYMENFKRDFSIISYDFDNSVRVVKNILEKNSEHTSEYRTCVALIKKFEDFKKNYE